MSAEGWERVKRLVDEALERSGDDRVAYLDRTCAGDEALRREVESLLAQEGEGALDTTEEPTRVGAALGHYQIEAEIGRGGMGRVYRAVDRTLGRPVAIKVLPGGFASDPERVKRFEREARLVASLNHTGIAAIHGLEREGETPFLVLELVEGGTLQDRLRRGPVPLTEALDLARQIAEALEAAHGKGVVHRDLKPSNVALTEEGAVKLLDFGLAKALSGPSSADEASGSHAAEDPPTTREGLILGTPPYMSPEQVGGGRVDHRSDIWSFGVVLWEMLAGRRLFRGESTSEVLGAVLREEPDWRGLPAATPPGVVALLRRCLTRDRKQRLQAIGEARIRLETPAAEPDVSAAPAPERHPTRWILAAGILGLAVGALLPRVWTTADRPRAPLVRSALLPPPGVQLQADLGFALSPDGSRLVFVARDEDGVRKLWVRPLAGTEARAIPGTDGAYSPFWSPDGQRLGFFASQSLKTVAVAGGAVRVLAEAGDPRGGTWGPDGRIVYAPRSRSGLFTVGEVGGTPERLTVPAEDELSHRWPSFLPGDERLVFLVQTAESGAADDRSRIEIVGPGGERRELLRANSSAAVAPSGHLLFWREGTLLARPLATGPTPGFAGPARPLVEGVGFDGLEHAAFGVGPPESLVYFGELEPPRRFEIVEPGGGRRVLDVPGALYYDLEASPDGRLVGYNEADVLWTLDPTRGTRSRVTFEKVDHYNLTWSPDGEWLAYPNNAAEGPGGRVFRQRSSGIGERELLYRSEHNIDGAQWSPDGRSMAIEEAADILLLDVESGETRPLVATERAEYYPRFSPDGRWLSFCADDSGRFEVYVTRTSGTPGRWPVSSRGGRQSRWSPSGDRLLFLDLDGRLQSAEFQPGEQPILGPPEPALPGGGPVFEFDVLGDDRLVLLVEAETPGPPAFTLVQNWTQLLGE